MSKKFFSAVLLATFLTGSSLAAENIVTGVVNFTTCVTDSKYGKKEQENFESLRKQMVSMIENTETQLREISAKFEDTDYLDGLSAKAEDELKVKFQTLQEELARYQQQFYQVLNHANHQMVQKINSAIAVASKDVAEKAKLDYVINKEACFYIRPDRDITSQVIIEMDKKFELDAKSKKLSENDIDLNASAETLMNRAG
jgi:outer membrane protein